MKKRRKTNIQLHDIIPFAAFLVIFIFFTIASYNSRNGTFMMLTGTNLLSLLTQSMQIIIVASGTLFVVAQGSTDMSVGVNLALSGVVGVAVGYATGVYFLIIPVTLLVGLLIGVFNGFVVAKLKVPSFMLTIAMLIGIRGLVNYIQTKTDVQKVPESMGFMTTTAFKIILFFVLLIIMAYIFEFTKVGRYCRAIGENENTARFVGVPIVKMKVIAFAISGLMAGFGAIFSLSYVGATSQQMGTFLEMKVIMAILLGGVLVTGGTSAKFYKILLGSFSIQIIINGLALMKMSDSYISQTVQGILLLIILALTAWSSRRTQKAPADEDESDIKEKAAV